MHTMISKGIHVKGSHHEEMCNNAYKLCFKL